MSVLALWDLDSALRNVLIEHLGSFNRMCPRPPPFEVFAQSTLVARCLGLRPAWFERPFLASIMIQEDLWGRVAGNVPKGSV